MNVNSLAFLKVVVVMKRTMKK